jgi:hypothetical protein
MTPQQITYYLAIAGAVAAGLIQIYKAARRIDNAADDVKKIKNFYLPHIYLSLRVICHHLGIEFPEMRETAGTAISERTGRDRDDTDEIT